MGAKAEKTQGQAQDPPTTSESPQAAAGALGNVKDLEQKVEKDLKCCGKACCSCWTRLGIKILLVILTVITVVLAIAVVVNALMLAQAITSYDPDNSGRAVSMIILIISVCCSGAAAIFANAAAFRKQSKNLKMSAIILAILAIVQLLIAILSGVPSSKEDNSLTRSLQESFNKALLHSPKAVEQWSITQYSLSCCGLNGPEDYRAPGTPAYFPPDIPISCCSSYQPSRSDLVQEREREACKVRKEYYGSGCTSFVVPIFNATSVFLASLTIVLLVFQFALTITSLWYAHVIGKRKVKTGNSQGEAEVENPEVVQK